MFIYICTRFKDGKETKKEKKIKPIYDYSRVSTLSKKHFN